MKPAYVTSLVFTGMSLSQEKEANVEVRPRSAKMDKFLRQVNGSPRYDVANVAAQVSQAVAQSKKVA